jgi:rhamnulokinase
MELEIREATGLSARASRSVIVRSVLESIVEGVSGVIDELSSITGTPMERIAVVGGGARISLLHELLAARTGLPVVTGSPEATALGNAIAQGIALGHFENVAMGRKWIEIEGDPS